MNEPWRKWTPETVRGLCMPEQPMLSDALRAFAALLEAEQKGERCVLPPEVRSRPISSAVYTGRRFSAWIGGSLFPEGQGQALEAAILDLARKLRDES